MTVLDWVLASLLFSIYFFFLFTVCILTFYKGYGHANINGADDALVGVLAPLLRNDCFLQIGYRISLPEHRCAPCRSPSASKSGRTHTRASLPAHAGQVGSAEDS